jgi:Papain family cysteine protease
MRRHTPHFTLLPEAVDWRGWGAVGPVKDQGVCGSCWTFSASQVMSSAWWMATGEYVSLSEQQVLDCSWGYGVNSACDGGDPDLGVKVRALLRISVRVRARARACTCTPVRACAKCRFAARQQVLV